MHSSPLKIQVNVFWVVTPTRCYPIASLHGVRTQKTSTWIFIAISFLATYL